jgi:hypothetical protein
MLMLVGLLSPTPAGARRLSNGATAAARARDHLRHGASRPYAPSSGQLAGVSCVTSTFCAAIGEAIPSLAVSGRPMLLTWSGSTWREQVVAVPKGAYDNLSNIACSSTKFCLAAGYSDSSTNLLETYDGRTWRSAGAPSDAATTTFEALACVKTGSCMAFGESLAGEPNAAPHADLWIDGGWVNTRAPKLPTGEFSNSVTGACTSATFCLMATNCDCSGPAGYGSHMSVWNGKRWTAGTAAIPATLSGVSCASSKLCMAVGWSPDEVSPAAFLWNGKIWTKQTALPLPVGTSSAIISQVSCPSTRSCIAIGGNNYYGQTSQLVAWSWSPSKGWTMRNIPTPTAYYQSTFAGLSCTSSTRCTAVGQSTPLSPGGANVFLSEQLHGTTWRLTSP